MSTTNGRSSSISPFYTLDWGGGGAITAIGWSGDWTASVEMQDGILRSQAGMQNLRTVLRPGESLRSPRILQMLWGGGNVEQAQNHFRQTMLARIVPRENGQPAFPPIVHLSTSFYELNATNEDNVLSHLRSTAGLGFELFWLDAYWTGPNGFPESMGNYGLPLESVEPPDRFPHGLKEVARQVHESGLGFLMWFEPERVAPGTRIAREHPEWVMSPGGDGSGLLNLGLPEARQNMTEYLDAAIKGYGLSWLRIDYNIDPGGYWQYMDTQDPDRVGMAEVRYVEGLYRMWDDLLAANPGLRIDNCASGGRRIDLETCARSTPLWRSDNTCDMVGSDPNRILDAAVKNQLMSAGLNRYLPFSTVGQMGADPYRFRSGFNGGIDFAEDLRTPGYPRELLREGIAEGKRIRPYWLGDFYALSEVTLNPRAWCVLQCNRPESGDGIVLGFRRPDSPYTGYECALRGMDPAARYEVTLSHTYTPEPTVEMTGAELAKLNLSITERPGSVLVEYRKAGG
jgi:alpha-galactosidase